jgi:hypothetical protein
MATKIQKAIRKMTLCKDGLMEIYDIEDVILPETILGLHQLADEAIIILKSPPPAKDS